VITTTGPLRGYELAFLEAGASWSAMTDGT
jgi:hypothetical protein